MSQTQGQYIQSELKSQVGTAFFLNFIFAFIEIIGGIYTGSFAILADALHDAGDCLSLGVAWGLEKYSRKTRDSVHTYGYSRYSLIGALLVSAVVLTTSIFVAWGAIERFSQPKAPASLPMIGFAILGVIVNGYAYMKMARSGHFLDQSLKWHLFEDAAGWIAVLLGAIVIHFTGWTWVDPSLALAIAFFVSWNVSKSSFQSFKILLQATPQHMNVTSISQAISEMAGILSVHDLHVWSLDGNKMVLTTHVVTKQSIDSAKIKKEIREKLKKFGHFHCTIEVEEENENCNDQC